MECVPGGEMKFDFWLALILTFSPREKEQPLWRSGCANISSNPPARISVRLRTILLLLGEKDGMRECVTTLATQLSATVNATHSRRFAQIGHVRQSRASPWKRRAPSGMEATGFSVDQPIACV